MLAIEAIALSAIGTPTRSDAYHVSHGRVLCGNVRFHALSPTLIRMEYSPTATFLDDATVSVIARTATTGATMKAEIVNGWITVSTARLSASYKLDSGPFDAENLVVEWIDARGAHSWRPSDIDDANLGGVPPTMDNVTEPVTAPGALSRNGYFVLDDSRSPVRDRKTGWITPRTEEGVRDLYFFVYGSDYAALLRELQTILGPIPMVPKYTLGVWFGSRACYDTDEWKTIVGRFREERIPLDVLMLDSNAWTNVIWAGYDWDYEQMPDPQGFFKWCAEHGVHVTLNEHYAALTPRNESNFEAICQAMGLPEGTEEIAHDLADRKYAELFMNLLHKPALDMGMSFWWQDGWAGANMEGLDPCMWTREVEYQGSERITGKRAFIFCRLGSAWGAHRYGSYFTGDMHANWPTLDFLVPATIRAGNMLVAYTNNDTAAIFGWDIEPELYLRWVQFATFSPIFRFHSIWGFRLPWEYGNQGVEVCREFLNLRERLVPYVYTYGRIAHETGMPIVRGMYLDYPDQERSYAYDHQFMFGREILVAPVTESAHGGDAVKDVFLPEGDDWYDYFGESILPGDQVITHSCPIDRAPVFVRAGSILPTAPEMDYVDETPLDPLTLDIYAGARAAEFTLYEDDGISLKYRDGAFAKTTIRFSPTGKGNHLLTVDPQEGKYKGRSKMRRYILNIHGLLRPKDVQVSGRKLPDAAAEIGDDNWSWDPLRRVTTVRLTEPISCAKPLEVRLSKAGSFEDARALHSVLPFREAVREVKYAEKLKYARALGGREHGKQPLVIRRTGAVERALDNMCRNPSGLSDGIPDLTAMAREVMASFVESPFDTTRAIPDLNDSCIESSNAIANVTFSDDELNAMRGRLIGARVVTRVIPLPGEGEARQAILAKLIVEPSLVADPQPKYAVKRSGGSTQRVIGAPTDAGNGWARFEVTNGAKKPSSPTSYTVSAEVEFESHRIVASTEVIVGA